MPKLAALTIASTSSQGLSGQPTRLQTREGEEALLRDFTRNPRSPLISIKAKPYHYKDCAILIGDAAHAMVPFYGQGLNCGLEDVRVLDLLLRDEGVNPNMQLAGDHEDYRLASALARYSETRHEDLVAICDLAMNNHLEVQHSVTTFTYKLRKMIDNMLYSLSSNQITSSTLVSMLSSVPFPTQSPSGWVPLYTMVAFRPDISYSSVMRTSTRQRTILDLAGWSSIIVAIMIVAVIIWVMLQHRG